MPRVRPRSHSPTALACGSNRVLAATPQADLPAYRGITLALNQASVELVDGAFALVERVGGSVVKPPAKTPWGGYSGYFADPDGHLWEVAHNPLFPIDEEGRIEIPA